MHYYLVIPHLVADVADVGPLSGVGAGVAVEQRGAVEALPAKVARKHLRIKKKIFRCAFRPSMEKGCRFGQTTGGHLAADSNFVSTNR